MSVRGISACVRAAGVKAAAVRRAGGAGAGRAGGDGVEPRGRRHELRQLPRGGCRAAAGRAAGADADGRDRLLPCRTRP